MGWNTDKTLSATAEQWHEQPELQPGQEQQGKAGMLWNEKSAAR